ncbi:MAG: hypothetical protein AAFY38_01565 [Pseudomonadota bacterium]
MKRFAFLIVALSTVGACASQGPDGYVPPSRAAADIGPVFAPLAFKPEPVVSSRSTITLF